MLGVQPYVAIVILAIGSKTSGIATESSESPFPQDNDLPRNFNAVATDPDQSWVEPWDEAAPWPDNAPQDLREDPLQEVSRRSAAPGPIAISKWPIIHPARRFFPSLGARKRHPPYHPVPRFRGASELADLMGEFGSDRSNGPRVSGATERSRNKLRTYSAGELLSILATGLKKEDSPISNSISLRYGMSR